MHKNQNVTTVIFKDIWLDLLIPEMSKADFYKLWILKDIRLHEGS